MKTINNEIKKFVFEPLILLKWVLFSCLIGVVVGLVSTGFYFSFQFVTVLRTEHDWLLFFLPIGGMAIVLIYHALGTKKDAGTNLVLAAVRENAALPLRTAPLIFISTLITHLFGGSAGREGAILQIGGSISSFIGRLMRLNDNDSRVITMCGMSAAFAALFGTPLTSAVFAMEVISVGVMYYAALVPCVLSAIVGVYTAKLCGVTPTVFVLSGIPAFSALLLLKVAGLGILCALVSLLFCRIMHFLPVLYEKYFSNPVLRALAGGVIVVLLTLITGTRDYNGSGGPVIAAALSGSAKPEAFILKILFTALTLGAGFKGGEIVPAFFTGATFGCVVSPLLGLSPAFGAALALGAVFCGVTNCPMTSLLLSFELFGGQQLPLFALCLAVSYMLSGYCSLYTEQKILYSKLKPVYINKTTK